MSRSVAHVTPARALAALSVAAPAACLELLCAERAAFVAGFSATELSQAVSEALGGLGGEGALRRAYASRIGGHYCDVLEARAAAEILRVLGSGLDEREAAFAERIVGRFPADPGVLRAAISVARARADASRLSQLLTALGYADRTLGTVGYVRSLRPLAPASGTKTVRAALLGSYTLDQLAPYVDLACRALSLTPELYIAPINAWERDVIDQASALRRFEPEITFLAVSIDDLLPRLAGPLSPEELEAGGDAALERVLAIAQRYTGWAAGRPLVVHSFHSAFAGLLGAGDGRVGSARSEWLARLNARLWSALRDLPSCYVLDVAETVATAGGSLGDNPKLRQLAALRLPPGALAGVADGYARFIAPLKGLTRKCVVLDLDNTLWGGVVGEDGKNGLRLGSTSPGAAFVELQTFLRSLPERGILLAINSKNNSADALEVIRNHEAMVLRESDFSAVRINWDSKPDNMRAIAAQLDIGLDSLIFVDDNPDERERMRQLLPEVLTVELPRDAARYRSVLENLPELQTLDITSDDRARAGRYRTLQLREDAKTNATSVEAYLQSLEIEVTIAAASGAELPRVVQLFSRTNQFNVTTRRYDAADVARFAADPASALWVLTSQDRFGNHGLVALALVRLRENAWVIDSLLMSCRVIGYGIETALLAFVAERARAAGAAVLVGEFLATAKNSPARDLFAKHGFQRAGPPGEDRFWHFPLERELAFPAWIERVVRDA